MPEAVPPAAEYSIATLLDIAMIPPDRIPDLLIQLPRLLDQIRPLVELAKTAGEDQVKIIAKSLIWVDDGITDGSKDERTITIVPMNP